MTIMRGGLWLPCATPAKAPIPSFVISSGPSASARQVLVSVRELGCAVGEPLRRELVRARVREVTRAVRSLGDRRGALCLALEPVVAADEDEPLERMVGLRPGLPAAGVVRAEQEPVHDRSRLLGVGEGVVEDPRESPADALGRLGDCGRRGPDRVRVELVRRPETDEHDSPGRRVPVRVQHSRPPDLGADLFLLGDALGVLVPREPGQTLRARRERRGHPPPESRL